MSTLQLDILTPEAEVFSGEITGVVVPGSEGGFEVRFNHAPLISTLAEGKIRVKTAAQGEKTYQSGSGVVEVLRNKVIVLVEKISEA